MPDVFLCGQYLGSLGEAGAEEVLAGARHHLALAEVLHVGHLPPNTNETISFGQLRTRIKLVVYGNENYYTLLGHISNSSALCGNFCWQETRIAPVGARHHLTPAEVLHGHLGTCARGSVSTLRS